MNAAVPDIMRRFVPAPYSHTLLRKRGVSRIESNDETLAGELAEYCGAVSETLLQAMAYIKIVVEYAVEQDGDVLTRVDAGPLRTLLRGTTTVLMYDSESRELFAFLAAGVSCSEFCQRLLPAIVCEEPADPGRAMGGITNE